jgi:hypothetical protein
VQVFSDPNRDFRAVCEGATLEILDGPNASPTNGGSDSATLGRYRVTGIQRLLSGDDVVDVTSDPQVPVPRPYTTSPTGLTGTVITVLGEDGVLEDPTQDFSDAVEGEIITITSGPNAGSYRLETLLGNAGGPVGGVPSGSGVTQVRVAPSLLTTLTRMPQPATGQSYRISLERLGVRTPFTVLGEDSSAQFYL